MNQKPITPCLFFAAAAALLSIARPLDAQTAATAQPADRDAAIQLPSFNVVSSEDSGYRASNSVSATGINTKIMDLPFSVTAFNQQFIEDTGAMDLADIAEMAAGVKNAAADFQAGTERMLVRGFYQYPEHDGVYEGTQGSLQVDPIGIDRVEVAKGPSSLLYGIVSPGGTVNYITKQAQANPFTILTVTGGSYDYFKSSIDYNQPLFDGTLLFRLNAGYEHQMQYEDVGKAHTEIIIPTLTWKATKILSFRVNYSNFDRHETPQQTQLPYLQVATPQSVVNSFNGALGYPGLSDAVSGKIGTSLSPYGDPAVDQGIAGDGSTVEVNGTYLFPKTFNYSSSHDYRTTAVHALQTEATLALGEHWNTRADFFYNKNFIAFYQSGISDVFIAPANTLTFSNGLWSLAPAYAALTAAQQLVYNANWVTNFVNNPGSALQQTQSGFAPPLVIPERAQLIATWADNYTITAEAAGIYKYSWGTLKPLLGLYYNEEHVTGQTYRSSGTVAAPYGRTWDVDPASPTYYVNRDNTIPGVTYTPLTSYSMAFDSTKSAYAVVDGNLFNDHVMIMGGARYNQSGTQGENYLTTTAAGLHGQGLIAHYTTPQVGVGYKFTPALMLYGSYSTSYTLPPSATTSSVTFNSSGVPVTVGGAGAKPVIGSGEEVGIKTNFFDGRVAATLSVNQITQSNVFESITETVTGPTGISASVSPSFQGTVQREDGLEFEITYSPIDQLQIVFNATDMNNRNISEPAGYEYFLNQAPYNGSRYTSNLWIRYNFGHIWIGGGYKYWSRYLGSPSTRYFYLPAYMEFDAAAGYDWKWNNIPYTLKINGQNLSNGLDYPSQDSMSWPRRILVSLKVRI